MTSVLASPLSVTNWQERGNYHLERKELDLAIDAFTKALEEAEEKKDLKALAQALRELGRVFMEKKLNRRHRWSPFQPQALQL